jgi:hypothetical protein
MRYGLAAFRKSRNFASDSRELVAKEISLFGALNVERLHPGGEG